MAPIYGNANLLYATEGNEIEVYKTLSIYSNLASVIATLSCIGNIWQLGYIDSLLMYPFSGIV